MQQAMIGLMQSDKTKYQWLKVEKNKPFRKVEIENQTKQD
jgi:hypothetical protein